GREGLEDLVEWIGETGSSAAEPLLMTILEKHRYLEPEVLLALSSTHSPSALQRLRVALQNPSTFAKSAAILGMARLGDRGTISDLLVVLEAPDGPAATFSKEADPAYYAPLDPGGRPLLRHTLHKAANAALFQLTGQDMHENPVRVRQWM